MITISVPTYQKVQREFDKSFTVFNIEVRTGGRCYEIPKRYSEFEKVHKRLKKIIRTPEFPPKKVLKWNHKILEQRRLGLERYLQLVLDRGNTPKLLLKFLEIDSHLGSTDSLNKFEQTAPSHQPILSIDDNIFLSEQKDGLMDVVTDGTLLGFYGSSEDLY